MAFTDSSDVQRAYDEQRPDPNGPCPHCAKPVREDKNIALENGRLTAHCGGSSTDHSGFGEDGGCFRPVAWNPDVRAWEPR